MKPLTSHDQKNLLDAIDYLRGLGKLARTEDEEQWYIRVTQSISDARTWIATNGGFSK